MTDNFARLLALMGGNGGGSTESIQVDTLPTPSADELGKIYQYIGNTTVNYTNGYFYKCVSETNPSTGVTTYSWVAIDTQEDTKHWIGTRAELTAALLNGEIENGTIILITDEPDVDDLPTQYSTNLVYSGGVWTALQGKENTLRFDTMPEPSQDLAGLIVLYNGGTTVNYTNGYFYKCKGSSEGGVTTYSWKRINLDDDLSMSSTNPVENRIITNAINKLNNFPKVKKTSAYNSAITSTKTQAQIDAYDGKILKSTIEISFMLDGVHGIDGTALEDQVVISVSGLTKDGATTYPYVSFLPDWDIVRVRPYTTAAGDQGTEITLGLNISFYEPDEVRNLANDSSITRAGGDSYSKDANGDITISIPEKFWHFYATCHYKG